MTQLVVIPNGDYLFSGIDCALECVFCVQGIAKRQMRERCERRAGRQPGLLGWLRRGLTRRPLPEAETASQQSHRWRSSEMVAEFHRAVSQDPRSEVVLAAHDILEFDRLFDLLGICEAHNKRVRLVSPGLRLADMAFARRLAPRISSFTITYLSHDADTYHRMTGNPQAQAQVQLTLQHLKALRVHVMVNYVVTRYNHRDLLGVAGYLLDQMGLDAFDLVMLIPEKGHADLGHDVGALLAPFPELNRELVRFTRRYHGTSKRLSLIDVPPCQVTEEALTSGILSFSPAPPDADLVRRVSYQSCASCHFASRCPRVFDAYLQRYPAEPVDVEKVNRNHHLLCDSSPPWGSGS